jgi:hypothetical protein
MSKETYYHLPLVLSLSAASKETYKCQRDLQKRPTNVKRDLLSPSPSSQPQRGVKRDLQVSKRPTKETYKCQKRPTITFPLFSASARRQKRPTKETYKCQKRPTITFPLFSASARRRKLAYRSSPLPIITSCTPKRPTSVKRGLQVSKETYNRSSPLPIIASCTHQVTHVPASNTLAPH